MTLEEMINWIADRDHLHEGTKIIAALKAGQRMRRFLYEEEVVGCHLRCCMDWDKATKEEDV